MHHQIGNLPLDRELLHADLGNLGVAAGDRIQWEASPRGGRGHQPSALERHAPDRLLDC